MPRYAYFDHAAPVPQQVIGWLDTDQLDYSATMPDQVDLMQVTNQQWDNRITDPAGFAVENGTLIPMPVPPPSADQVYAAKIADGIALTSTGTPALTSTYPIDPASMALIGAAARDAASGLGLPHGLPTVPVADIDGVVHDFSEPAIIATYKASRDLVYVMGQQRDIMAGGGTPAWPPQTATIP